MRKQERDTERERGDERNWGGGENGKASEAKCKQLINLNKGNMGVP